MLSQLNLVMKVSPFLLILLQVSWTHALRQIVINCYKYHGREDLLPAFSNEDDKEKTKAVIQAQSSAIETLTSAQGVSSYVVYNIHIVYDGYG